MDLGQIISIFSRLILGGLTTFFAVILWSRTRNIAWMLIILSTITIYTEIICSILEILGILNLNFMYIGSVSLPSILLPALQMVFLMAAFLVMIRK